MIQIQLFLKTLILNEDAIAIRDPNLTVYLTSLSYDGIKIKPALEYCRHQHAVVGCTTGPMNYNEIKRLQSLTIEELTTELNALQLATEALQFGLLSFDGKAFIAAGHYLVNDLGDSSQLRDVIDGAISACQTCTNCINISETIVNSVECVTVCSSCLKSKKVCTVCRTNFRLSGDQWKPTRRPCRQCLEDGSHCKRLLPVVLPSDCLEKQKKIINDLHSFHKRQEHIELFHPTTGKIIPIDSADDPHTDKNIISVTHNHMTYKDGEIITSKNIEVIRRHPDFETSKPMKDAITTEAIFKMDRMSNSHHMQNVRLEVASELERQEKVVFTHSQNLRQKRQDNRWSKQKVEGDKFENLSGITVTGDAEIYMLQKSGEIIQADFATPPTCKVIATITDDTITDVEHIPAIKSLLICASGSLKQLNLTSNKVSTMTSSPVKTSPVCITHDGGDVWITDRNNLIHKFTIKVGKTSIRLTEHLSVSFQTKVFGICCYQNDMVMVTLPNAKRICALDRNSLVKLFNIDLPIQEPPLLISSSETNVFVAAKTSILSVTCSQGQYCVVQNSC